LLTALSAMLEWLPENVSSYGGDIDAVMYLIYYLVGAWFIATQAVLLYFVVRYRRKPGRKATYERGDTARSAAWVLVPAVLVLGSDLLIEKASHGAWVRIKQTLPENPDLVVRINGKQFVWEFTHPGLDGELDTDDDIITYNHLHVPVGAVVQYELVAEDVIHSFFVPALRYKQDAVPGRTIRGWFEATKPGRYPIVCAELCGIGHGMMHGLLHVHEDYEAWVLAETEGD
jgi:cytochrome c oxidase subunit II